MVERAKIKVGRRKTSIARVRLVPGSGSITVNGKKAEEYFTVPRMLIHATGSLKEAHKDDTYDVHVNVRGGGISGQAGAVRLGLARALVDKHADVRGDLKKLGMLRRDPRMVERKKYGLHKARRGTQFSKR